LTQAKPDNPKEYFMKFSEVFTIGSLFVTVPFVYWAYSNEPEKPEAVAPTQAETDIGEARFACREFIKRELRDPDSAEWGMRSGNFYASWPASIEGDVVTVAPTFRAKNGFGALGIHTFICKVQIADDKARLVSLTET
jgi:hypothetical protein